MSDHRATYSPEDNKLRFYPDWDDPAFDKEDAKAVGYRWASKQECYVCPRWTPQAEDFALDFVEQIEDEDYSPLERAADRAERFEGYRGKRFEEATGHADTFDNGPSVFGNQSQARADRQARRHDRHRSRAVSQWSKADYWQQRTAGVISHALHKAHPRVRRGRILTLEAEQRKHQTSIDKAIQDWDRWAEIATMDGADELIPLNEGGYGAVAEMNHAQRVAYALANTCHGGFKHPDPEVAAANLDLHRYYCFSAYDFLTDDEYRGIKLERFSPKRFAEFYASTVRDPRDPDTYSARWARHYEMRLLYENAMLENEGGKVAEVEMIPGGFIGEHQIFKVNKSRATGRVVSVMVRGSWGYTKVNGRNVYLNHAGKDGLAKMNIERLGEDAYRAPTAEELATFQHEQKEAKKKAKATKKKAPSLINPTDKDAELLQAVWNERERAKHVAKFGENCSYSEFKPAEVLRITQKQYSANSKGDYAALETRLLYQDAKPARRSSNLWSSEGAAYDATLNGPVCKLRMRAASGFYAADRVIVLTDKPQKPLPLDWERIENPERVNA